VSVEYGIITSVVCPGGWHFPQVLSSGQTVRIIGFSFEQLLENMLEFRRRHPELCGGTEKAKIESVRADLKDYLCAHFRQNCADAPKSPMLAQGGGIGISTATSYARPIDKAGDWLAKLGHQRLDFIDAALAAQRAQICSACPQNVRWATPCAPCNETISVRIQNAKGSHSTPYDRHLFVCRAFGHTNEVAIWLKDTHSTSDQKPPAICWKAQP
jgi:hypothetical protein